MKKNFIQIITNFIEENHFFNNNSNQQIPPPDVNNNITMNDNSFIDDVFTAAGGIPSHSVK